jgi:hypothetical protein
VYMTRLFHVSHQSDWHDANGLNLGNKFMFIFGFLKKVKKNPVPGSDVFSGPRERERRGGGSKWNCAESPEHSILRNVPGSMIKLSLTSAKHRIQVISS